MKSNKIEKSMKYEFKIITNLNNTMILTIEIKDSKLFINCYYYKNYFKKTFNNSFTLDELKELSPYYKQFNKEEEILNEIMKNNYKGKESIEGNEEQSKTINLIIPLPGAQFSKMSFGLKLIVKTHEEIVNEYKNIVFQYEEKFKISNFNIIFFIFLFIFNFILSFFFIYIFIIIYGCFCGSHKKIIFSFFFILFVKYLFSQIFYFFL